MLNDMLSYLFPLIQLACGIAIVIRFRGSPAGLLGGIAFGIFVTAGLTQRVLGALDVSYWEWDPLWTLLYLAAWGCLLGAILTGRAHDQGPGTAGDVVAGGAGMGLDAPLDEGPPPAHPGLRGIGGWLILPAIGFVLGGVLIVAGLVISLAVFDEISDAGYGGLWAFEILVTLALLIFLVYTGVQFFRKKKGAPRLVIALMIANLVSSLFLLVFELGSGADDFAVESGRNLIGGVFSAAIWIPYFIVSKRVKATFVE